MLSEKFHCLPLILQLSFYYKKDFVQLCKNKFAKNADIV